jgi:hypothetical protein
MLKCKLCEEKDFSSKQLGSCLSHVLKSHPKQFLEHPKKSFVLAASLYYYSCLNKFYEAHPEEDPTKCPLYLFYTNADKTSKDLHIDIPNFPPYLFLADLKPKVKVKSKKRKFEETVSASESPPHSPSSSHAPPKSSSSTSSSSSSSSSSPISPSDPQTCLPYIHVYSSVLTEETCSNLIKQLAPLTEVKMKSMDGGYYGDFPVDLLHLLVDVYIYKIFFFLYL